MLYIISNLIAPLLHSWVIWGILQTVLVVSLGTGCIIAWHSILCELNWGSLRWNFLYFFVSFCIFSFLHIFFSSLFLGTVGFLSCFWFVSRIYSVVKVDWVEEVLIHWENAFVMGKSTFPDLHVLPWDSNVYWCQVCVDTLDVFERYLFIKIYVYFVLLTILICKYCTFQGCLYFYSGW